MSHYKPYPAYKDSGVEWLGRAPEHWRFELLTNVSRFQSGKAHEPFIDDDGYFICVNSRFVSTGGLSQKHCTQNLSPACVDDILMVMSDLPNGRALAKAFYSDKDGVYAVNQRVCIISPVACTPRFLFYLLDRNCHFLSHDDGINQTHLPNSAFTKFKFYLPPSSEQQAIALVLDRETARIDALVAKKTRFIELLSEKRQALITHVVTKGLDPNVKMKDSGVEWLGEVPEHWDVLSLKCDLAFLTSGSRGWAEHYADEGAVFLRIGNLARESLDLDLSDIQHVVVPDGAEGERTRVMAGDVLFSITAYLGSVAIVSGDLPIAYVSQHVALARLQRRILRPRWVGYVALSWLGKAYLESQGYGGTKIQLSLEDIANMLMTVPPQSEQELAEQHLDRETARIDALLRKTERSIELLKERRSALITAAVTGQIDLREAV